MRSVDWILYAGGSVYEFAPLANTPCDGLNSAMSL